MSLILAVHINDYLPGKQRFSSEAFEPSSEEFGGGVSAICEDCAKITSGTVCNHIAKFYSGQVGNPIIFWTIDPFVARRDGIVVEETLSTTGDHCHRDIKGLKKSECRTCIKSAPLSDFTICPDVQASHQILADKLTEWQNSIRDAR